MNIEKFWKIIDKTDVIKAISGKGNGVEKAITILSKFCEEDILTFANIYAVYHQLLVRKYMHFLSDGIPVYEEDEEDLNNSIDFVDFIIGLGQQTFYHFYNSSENDIEKAVKCVDIILNKYNSLDEEDGYYVFESLPFLAIDSYEKKINVSKKIDEELTNKLNDIFEKTRVGMSNIIFDISLKEEIEQSLKNEEV